jgi:putative PIN family toxin of toxin-antitoxin system
MRIVLDSSVIVAAFAAYGLCEAIFELCLGSHQILLSEVLLNEIRMNLDKKLKIPATTIDNITSLLRENGTLLTPVAVPTDSCRDPNDLHVLGLVVEGEASFLVTGDKDLLSIAEFQGSAIVSPRQFSDIIHKKE